MCMYLARATNNEMPYDVAAALPFDEFMDAFEFYAAADKAKGKFTMDQAKRAVSRRHG